MFFAVFSSRVAQLALHAGIEPVDAADGEEADVVLHQRLPALCGGTP